MALVDQVREMARAIYPEIVAIRRDIHMNPELGFEVHRTAGIAAAALKELGLAVREGVGKSGVVGDLRIPEATRTIALRADMDALPIQELNDPPYKSRVEGYAHMCGHDAHTAMLIGAARILTNLKSKLRVNVRFIFQPNEEKLPGGARFMIEDGALEGVDEVYGLHVWPYNPTGTVQICEGPALAQPDDFDIQIIGKGGHAAMPEQTVDPIIIGAQLVNALQSVVSRNIDPKSPGVLSVTGFHAGSAHNVISPSAHLMGTIRTFDPAVQKTMRARLEQQVKAITGAHGADYQLDYVEGYPVTFNHKQAVDRALGATASLLGGENLVFPGTPSMGGEDFAYYAQKVPGCFIFLGVRNEEKGFVHMLHDPRFDLDEEAMPIGMGLHSLLALQAEN
ncbi:MAG: amidohydrolase [Calditrichaeota bacterium]|nr:amidohydrolase [Calditrichota bacterium]